MKFEIGDLVRGITNNYGITDMRMKRGIVVDTNENRINARIIKHDSNCYGTYWVYAEDFEKIGHAETFDRDKFNDLLKESKEKAAEYLSGANLSGADLSGANLRRADLSGANGLLSAINFMEAHFERTEEGYICYKTFNSTCTAPEKWKIEPGEIIEENVNFDRCCDCGCGINVAPVEWVRKHQTGKIYKMLIRFEWLPEVVVPFNTDGKIRCGRAQILEIV